jgi:hypothetical protein
MLAIFKLLARRSQSAWRRRRLGRFEVGAIDIVDIVAAAW